MTNMRSAATTQLSRPTFSQSKKKSPRPNLGQVLSLGLVRCQQMCKNYKTFLDRLRGQNDQNIMLKPEEFIYKGPNEKVENKNKF